MPGRSGKLAALEELVDVIVAEGESVLVFSQFVECLSLVEARLEHLGIPTLFLHGKVGAKRRTEMVDAFQAGKAPVLLLSLKAGGVGLNLTRATHVVHYDRWWNPAVEDQATDRAHRIGQDRPVQVHRLIAEGTLEDRIAALIERKRSLAEAVVGGGRELDRATHQRGAGRPGATGAQGNEPGRRARDWYEHATATARAERAAGRGSPPLRRLLVGLGLGRGPGAAGPARPQPAAPGPDLRPHRRGRGH